MDFAQHLKSSVDIVRVIGEYGVKLRKASPNRYQGLCPFHTEKTPSFSVYTQIQRYKCFGCNESGDVIKFVEKIENLSFWEALKELAERNGIPLPKRTEYTDPETKLRAAIYEMHEIAAEAFKSAFRTAAAGGARDYVVKRGLTPALVDQFGIGFSDPSGQALTRRFREKGFSDEQLENSGLVRRREDGSFYDYFRGRLIFPIHSETGKIVAFAGRALKDEEPKYLNSPQTPIYQKSNILYNLNRARNSIHKFDHSVLVEGYMDVIGVFSAGVEEVVASCGTALTQQQVKMLKRHSERIVVNYDPDNAGANAAERSIQMFLEEGMQVRVLELEEGLDPDEYVGKFGADVYRKKLETATNYFQWLADRARKKFDVRSAEGRMQGFQFLLPAIQRIPGKLERLAIANDVASYLGVEAGAVLEHFRKSAGDRKNAPAVKQARPALPPVERILLKRVLFDAGAREAALPRLAELPSLGRMATERIFRAILACDAQGEAVEFSHVEARLDETSKALLHEVAFADDIDEATDAVEETLACLNTLEGIDMETQRAELRAKVKAAERSGNMQEALHWNRELMKLERSGV